MKTTWTRLFWSSDEPEQAPASPVKAPIATTPATGDPKVDQVLIAFESMQAAMPAAQLAIAIRATAKAIGIDPTDVATALAARLAAIETAVEDARAKATERAAAREAEVASAAQKVRAEIEAMEQTIAARRQQLADVSDKLKKLAADERAQLATVETKARDEGARLAALRDFLASKRP